MAKGPKIRGGSSKQSSLNRRKSVSKNENLGNLMRKHRDLDEVLYPFTSSIDMVFDDMDFTIEEFSDMTGADLEDLITEINRVVH